MTLYSRKGDDGRTHLLGTVGVRKDDPRIEAVGAIDELNSAIGLVLRQSAETGHIVIPSILGPVQTELFTLGARLASLGTGKPPPEMSAELIERMERDIDAISRELTPTTTFILPGGCELACRLHMARVICRRAERVVVGLLNPTDEELRHDPLACKYLNRLADLLFTLARLANRDAGEGDALPDRSPAPQPHRS